MKLTAISLALGGAMASTALAGDPMPMQQPMMESPTLSWTGFYLGLQAGINFDTETDDGLVFDSNLDGNYNDTVPFGQGAGNGAFGRNFEHEFDEALSGGIVVGYDQQFGNFVLGALLDHNFTNVEESQSGFSSTPAFYREVRSVDNISSFRLRFGVLATERTLLYLTGGVVYGDPEYSFDSNNPNRTSSGDNDGDVGYALGGGVETRLTANWSLTLEYLYTNFGAGDFVTNFTNGPFATQAGSTNVRGAEDDFAFHTVQAKLTYRF